MTEYSLKQLRSQVTDGSGFADDTIFAVEGDLAQLPSITLVRNGVVTSPLAGCRFEFAASVKGNFRFSVRADPAHVSIGANTVCTLDVRLWRQPVLQIGAGTTINGARLIVDDTEVTIGADCLISDEVLFQSNDQHGLFDLTSMALTNQGRRKITVGEHVWIGRRATIMPDAQIGAGSVVGVGAIVTSRFGPCSYLVGVPARAVRQNATWTRSPYQASAQERAFFARIKAQGADLAGPDAAGP